MSTSKSLTTIVAGQISTMLKKNQDALIRTLPKGFNYDRMCRSVVNAISTTPAISKCTPASIFLSTVRAFSMGLEPNGPLGHGYLVPFGNTCTFMPGYRGLIDISRRSGEISIFRANFVCKNDKFNVNALAFNELHVYDPFSEDRGEIVGYYAIFVLKDGTFDFETMRMSEIEDIKKRSKCSNHGPWKTDYSEMCKKTVIKRLAKRAPASIELSQVVEMDHKASMGESQDGIIDVAGIEITEEEEKGSELAATELAKEKAKEATEKSKVVDADLKIECHNIMGVLNEDCRNMINTAHLSAKEVVEMWKKAGQDINEMTVLLMEV